MFDPASRDPATAARDDFVAAPDDLAAARDDLVAAPGDLDAAGTADRRRGGCEPQPDAPGRGRHRKAVLEPAILLSLLGDEAHGYELIDQVQDLVGDEVCVDPGSVYRMLRTMESDGLVASSWIITERGPNRRSYTITSTGRDALSTAVAELRRRARSLEALADTAADRLARSSDRVGTDIHPESSDPEGAR